MTRIAAIIPARMASSRYPGKPLRDFHGLPMVEHVRRRTVMAGLFSEVVVATCDREIFEAVALHGGHVLMTSPAHEAASDRVAEAMRQLDCTHVVNVQGDEVLILPEYLERLARAMAARPDAPAWNAIAPIENAEELRDRAAVKCVVSASDRVMFCSRDFSLLPLKGPGFDPVHRILGIVGFERTFLERYPALVRTPLEIAESIDQSRIVENDVPLQAVRFTRGYPGVNEPREARMAEAFLESDPRQREILHRILNGRA
jgi:3-deoxy-manno-octulosonate cytidylyltransferase (CMP-KDO synthetase)